MRMSMLIMILWALVGVGQDAQPLPPVLSIAGELSANIAILSGDNGIIGQPVIYIWNTRSLGVLVSIVMDCGDGTTQTQNLFNQPPASDGSLTIIGFNYVATASICYPSVAGTLHPSLTITDSAGSVVTVSTTNTTNPIKPISNGKQSVASIR